MAPNIRRIASLALFAAAIGCPRPVSAPTAQINDGAAAITGISVGQLVHLDGTKSADPSSRDLTYDWSFARLPVGSTATLNDPHSQTPSFVADVPSVDATNTYVVQLVVSNAFISSAPSQVRVTVSQCGGRAPVIAAVNAAPPSGQTAFGVGSLVSLSASVTDPDNQTADQICAASLNQTISYQWKLVGQPASSTAQLNNPTAVAPSFVADVAGDYTLRLVTTDSTGRSSAPFDQKITVTTCGSNAPTVTSVSPVSEQLAVSKTIQMTAIVDDADNDATCQAAGTPRQTLSYAWSLPQLPNGSRATLNSATAQNASFTPDVDGDYDVRLVVTDSTGRTSAPRDTGIHITKCGNNAPVASIVGVPSGAAPSAGYIGGLLQFGASVLDADQDTIGTVPPACSPIIPQSFKLQWALRAVPAGSTAQLNNPSSTQPSFTPDVSGQYKIELVATDQSGLSSLPASVTVGVTACGNNPPSAVITGNGGLLNNGVVNGGSVISLGAIVSDSDILTGNGKCGLSQTFSYAWSMSSRPPGSSAFVVNPTTDPSVAPATFTADVPNGSYQVQLVVTDSTGLKSVPSFFNVNTNGCGTNRPTIVAGATGADLSQPNPGQKVTLTAVGADADNGAACSPALASPQALTYQWTQVSRPTGSSTTLTTASSNGSVATFTPDAIGSYQFSVVVTDSTGLSSAPTYVTVGTSSCGSHAPVVSAVSATPSTVQPLPNPGSVSAARVAASTVTLANTVTDGDDACFGGVQPRTYVWSVVQRPASSSAVLSDPTSAAPTFIPDVTGDYQFQVVVTDSLGLTSTPAFVNVHATSCSLLPPAVLALTSPSNPTQLSPVTMPAPTFDSNPALQNCVATPGAYTYRWSMVAQPSGSQAVLDNPASPSPKFTPDKVGNYVVSVVVVDDAGIAADPVYLQVTVGACGTTPLTWQNPAVTSTFTDPQGAASLQVGAQVKLVPHAIDGNVSCGAAVTSALTYKWAIIAAPAGSRAALTSTTEASPTFVPDVQGTYQLSAIATDSLGNQSGTPGFVTVTTGSCGANVPAVTLVPNNLSGASAINSYFLQQVSVVTNDADNVNASCPARFNNVSFTYAWSITTTPPGGRAQISSATGSSTTFEAFEKGTGYQLHVVATGSNGIQSDPNQAGSFLTIDVKACGSNAPVIQSIATQDSGTGAVVSRPAVGQSIDVIPTATDSDSSCGAGGSVTGLAFSAVSLPGGTAAPAFFSTAGNGKLTLVPDVAGTYVYSVVATDNTGLQSAPVEVSISTAACGPTLPALQATTTAGALVIANNATSSVTGRAINLALSAAPSDTCVKSPSFAYAWTLTQRPAGSQATLSSLTAASTAVTPDTVGVYGLQLVVTDNAGLTSAPSTLTVNVGSCGTLKPVIPGLIATPGAPNAGQLVQLATSAAIADANNGCGSLSVTPFSYRWSLIAVPGSSSAQLSSATAASPEFTADVPNGLYQVALTVTDALGNVSDPAFLAVQSSKCGVNVPVLTLPAALSVNANTNGSIAASATDADNLCGAGFGTTVPQINWSVVSAPAGARPSLTSTATATVGGPTFTASNGFQADVPGTYVVQAVAVAQNGIQSAARQTTVTVSACGASTPAISGIATTDASGTVARPPVGDSVTVTAWASDPDHVNGGVCGAAPLAAAQYLWSVVSAPAGYSQAVPVPTGLTGPSITLVPNVAGIYTLSVVAASSTGIHSQPMTLTIPTGSCFPVVANAAGFSAPIGSTPASPVTAGLAVNLSMGVASSTCVSGGAAPTAAWSFTSKPASSGAALTGSTGATPSFTADVPGTYGIQLVVTDNGGYSNVYTTTVTAGACNPPSIVNTGAQPLTAANLYSVVDPQSASTSTIYNGGRVTLGLPAVSASVGGAQAGSCGGVAGYQWAMISRPSGSGAVLSSATDAKPSFVADVAGGTWQFSVLVKDAQGNASAPFFFSLTSDACGTYAPSFGGGVPSFPATAHANAAFAATAPAVTDGNAACPARFLASGYSYAYAITAQPAGSQASISGAGNSASVSVNKGGGYTVQVIATSSSNGKSTAAASAVASVDACGSYPPVATSFSLSQSVPNTAGGSTVVSDGALPAGGASLLAGGTASSATSYYVGVPVSVGATVSDADYQGGTCTAFALPAQGKSYAWSLVSAPAASHLSLGIANTGTVVFTPDVTGSYTASLTTTDSNGYAATSTVTFPVGCGNSAPAIASTSASQTVPGATGTLPLSGQNKVALGFPVGLDNTASDADATAGGACGVSEAQALSYQWAFTAVPAGSKTTLTAANTKTASFTPDTTGNYVLSLTVTDPQGHATTLAGITYDAECDASAPAVVLNAGVPDYHATQTVTVNGGQTLAITRSSNPAASSAVLNGVPQAVPPLYPNVAVQLAANVTDADSAGAGVAGCGVIAQTFTYQWAIASQPSGSVAQITNPTDSSPSFTPDLPGNYSFALTVTDQTGRSSTTTLPATVVGTCGTVAPIAVAKVTGPIPGPSTGPANEPVSLRTQLDATGSAAADNSGFTSGGPVVPAADFPAGCGLRPTLAYSWKLTAAPAGSTTSLTGNTLLDPSFVPDQLGTYTFDVAVSDGRNTTHAQATVNATAGYLSAPGSGNASYSATTVDGAGNPVVAWLDSVTNTVNVSRCTSGCSGASPVWQTLPSVDTNVVVAAPTAGDEPHPLAVAVSGGSIMVAYFTGSSVTGHSWSPCEGVVSTYVSGAWTPRYFGEQGSGCDAAFTTGSAVGRYLAIQTDPISGRFELAYSSQSLTTATSSGTATNSATLHGLDCPIDGSFCNGFVTLVPVAAPAKLGRWVSVKAEPNGVYDLAFYVDDNGSGAKGLRYGRCTTGSCFMGGAWNFMDVDFPTGGDVGRFSSVDVIPGNTDANPGAASIPVIAYRDFASHTAKFARCTGGCTAAGNWSTSTIPDAASTDYGRGTQVAVNPATGYPRVAYVDVQNGKVRVLSGLPVGTFSETAEFSAQSVFDSLSMTYSGGVRMSFNSGSGLQFFAGP